MKLVIVDYGSGNLRSAAKAFERYDLVSAPVVDRDGKLVGRVAVNVVMDFIREEAESDMLSAGGLREEEDLFASVWSSVKNRCGLPIPATACTAPPRNDSSDRLLPVFTL